MIFDAHIERRTSLVPNLGIPRWHKRINYYIYKINFLQIITKKISRIPGKVAYQRSSLSGSVAIPGATKGI
jgi:hypothetical protein